MRAIQPRSSQAPRNVKGKGLAGRSRWNSAGARYEVLDRVGEGTLFVVYRVRDRSSNRVMALKALKSAFNKHPRFAEALAGCLERTLGLAHPHLAGLSEVSSEEGTLFLVSEWLPGQSLESRLRHAPFGRAEALSSTRQIAEALDYLHQNGALHGDLRPRQIGSAADGKLKLTDGGFHDAFAAAGLALTDVVADAAYYQAPERSDGAPPTPSSDLYALGVILYRMLTGRVPFDGPSPLAIATRHRRNEPLRPTQFNPQCPPDLEAVALRLLEKDPAARYASAAHLLRELSAGTSGSGGSIGTPGALGAASTSASISGNAASQPSLNGASGVAATGAAASAAGAAVGTTTAAGGAAGTVTQPLPPRAPTRGGSRGAPGTSTRGGAAGADDDLWDDDDSGAVAVTSSAAADDDRQRRRKQRRREAVGAGLAVFWLLVAIGLLGGIFYGSYSLWQQETPREVKVPNYLLKHETEARRLLQSKGLKLVVVSQEYNPRRAAGTVLTGDPRPGKKVRTGREIAVTVSRGEEQTTMPDLTELDLQRVRQIIERGGMRLGAVSEQYHDTVPRGYVCGQYPLPGQNFRRSVPINLLVSRGPQPSEYAANPAQLPPPPVRASPTPAERVPLSTGTQPAAAPEVALVSRIVQVRVPLPIGGSDREVRVVVQDADGEHTVYQKTHAPGDLVDIDVQVTRPQGTTAVLRVFVDGNPQPINVNGQLQNEQRI